MKANDMRAEGGFLTDMPVISLKIRGHKHHKSIKYIKRKQQKMDSYKTAEHAHRQVEFMFPPIR
jgi:hypothetical protein